LGVDLLLKRRPLSKRLATAEKFLMEIYQRQAPPGATLIHLQALDTIAPPTERELKGLIPAWSKGRYGWMSTSRR